MYKNILLIPKEIRSVNHKRCMIHLHVTGNEDIFYNIKLMHTEKGH